MKRPLWGLGGLLFLSALPTAARAEAVVPPAQQQCFQVQFLLRLPGLEARHFIQSVQALGDLPADDEAGTARRITALNGQAAILRRDEAQALAEAATLLKSMGAVPSLQTWAGGEADALSRPLRLSKDQTQQARSDPETAAILATLDEADALKTDTDSHLATLGLWINLTHGRVGLWAADMGELAAALHIALADQEVPRLSVTLARHLRSTAPAGTPAAVNGALGLLAPPTGNLSDLAPDPVVPIPLSTVSRAEDALLAAFGTPRLLHAAEK